MYRCQYCKNNSPYVTNNETHFRAHIQKHFRNQIDHDRLDFLIESIHSASQVTVWNALNAMYKIYDIQDQQHEARDLPKVSSKRLKVEHSKVPQTRIEKLPMIEDTISDPVWSSTIAQNSQPEMIQKDSQTNIEPNSSAVMLDQSVQIASVLEPVNISINDMFPQTPVHEIENSLSEMIETSTSIDDASSSMPSQEEKTNDSIMNSEDVADTLEQVIQFSNLNFQYGGGDIFFYIPDDECDLNSNDLDSQVCVVQHISVQDDGLTHVTLEPSLLPDSFIPQDAQVLPAEMNDSNLLLNAQITS